MYKEKIKAYLRDGSESQGDLSKKIGISASALSLYLKGDYKTPEALEVKIAAFFDLIETAGSFNVKKPKFVTTSISSVILSSITYCHVQKSMGIIYGDAGVGKTISINEYAKNHPEALVIRAGVATSRPLAFLKSLARKLKCSYAKRLDEIYLDLVDKLMGTEKIIIIDEAQHLPYTTLDCMWSEFNCRLKALAVTGF